ncbi:hypothetical protein GALL_472090 [mine drainage metagenome]|uniref:Uncharacterized protein n=1 Tax=mine drainage metagenome TaxID=410659 RepID=A0A1J5PTW1_9ZZZZ
MRCIASRSRPRRWLRCCRCSPPTLCCCWPNATPTKRLTWPAAPRATGGTVLQAPSTPACCARKTACNCCSSSAGPTHRPCSTPPPTAFRWAATCCSPDRRRACAKPRPSPRRRGASSRPTPRTATPPTPSAASWRPRRSTGLRGWRPDTGSGASRTPTSTRRPRPLRSGSSASRPTAPGPMSPANGSWSCTTARSTPRSRCGSQTIQSRFRTAPAICSGSTA